MRNNKQYNQLGQYGIDVSKLELINAATERKLSKRIKAGDIIARNMLVKANLRLVLTLAHKYVGNGVSLEDLIAEGNSGLITAADRFDGSKGNRFSTYAYWWIKESMFTAMEIANNFDNITVPLILEDPEDKEYVIDNIYKKEKDNTGIQIFNYVKNHDVNEKVESENEIDENMFKTVILQLDKLTKRESDIIKHYYGICNCEELDLTDLSEKYQISKMRVSAIIETSLRKIRSGVMSD